MRYRHSRYRYATVVHFGSTWTPGGLMLADRLRLLVEGRWRPDADSYETATTFEIIVDLAGVDEDDFEVHLFEDALVVEGHRRLPARQDGGVYHAAGVRQGPFRLELPLPAPIDGEQVEAHYDRGLLCISLPKQAEPR